MIWFIGAGPGDPDLITVKGLRCLQQAEVVVYDRLVSSELLDQLPVGTELHYVGKTPGSTRNSQPEINHLLIQLGRSGRRVVRLKGGDPFVFGRGFEECQAVHAAGIDFEVVPGISSALAAPASADIPVTHRGLSRNFAVVTAQANEAYELDYPALKSMDTLVVLMGRARLGTLSAGLIAAGKPPQTPVACIERGTTQDQRVIRCSLVQLAEYAQRYGLENPVTVVIGEVAGLQLPEALPLKEASGW